jgi:hypothetical protein
MTCSHTGCATGKQSGVCDYASCPKAQRLQIATQIAAGMWSNPQLIVTLESLVEGPVHQAVAVAAFNQADALINRVEQG